MATDAFENLRLLDRAEEPRTAFRATLRARLERELGLSSQSTTTQGAPMPPKTLNGARVGDVFMSLIHSAELNGQMPFDYLVALLRHHSVEQ